MLLGHALSFNRLSASGGAPSLSLNFAGATSLDPKITFTRASTATYTNSAGLIASAATNAPRFDYDPVTLQPKGLLIEEQRTNLLTYSEQFDNAAWSTTGGVTVAPNNATDPAGGLTADTATFTGSSYRYQGYATAIAGLTFTFSIWVSSTSGKNTIGVRIANNEGTESQFVLVNLTSTPQRISVTKTFTAASTAVFGGLDNRTVIVGGAQTTGDVIVWGAQLEAGAFATSYISTVASQVTRAADNAVMTGTNFSSWFNATEGTFAGAYDYTSGVPVTSYVFATNPISVGSYAAMSAPATSNTTGWYASGLNLGTAPATVGNKQAFGYSSAGVFNGSLNGAAVVSSGVSDFTGTSTALYIGARSSGGAINGHIRSITYWPRRLSNAELQGVTA